MQVPMILFKADLVISSPGMTIFLTRILLRGVLVGYF